MSFIWNIFKKYEDIGISVLAVLFVAILGFIFFWIATSVFADLNRAIAPSEGNVMNTAFDLDGARHLHLKGQTVTE